MLCHRIQALIMPEFLPELVGGVVENDLRTDDRQDHPGSEMGHQSKQTVDGPINACDAGIANHDPIESTLDVGELRVEPAAVELNEDPVVSTLQQTVEVDVVVPETMLDPDVLHVSQPLDTDWVPTMDQTIIGRDDGGAWNDAVSGSQASIVFHMSDAKPIEVQSELQSRSQVDAQEACPVRGSTQASLYLGDDLSPKYFWETDPFLRQIFVEPEKHQVDFKMKRPVEALKADSPEPEDVLSLLKKSARMELRQGLCDKAFSFVAPGDEAGRRKGVLSNWASLLGLSLESFKLGRTILGSGTGVTHDELVSSLDSVFSRKATATLAKRFYALNAFVRFAAAKGLQIFPLEERVLFEYLQSLETSEVAGPTTGRSCMEAVRFTCGVLGLDNDLDIQGPARLEGAVAKMMTRSEPIRQADALTVAQVMHLERLVVSAEKLADRVILGGALVLIYSCGRFSDGQRAKRLIVDLDPSSYDPTNAKLQGYLELQVLGHKGARSDEQRRQFLPLIAPAFSMSNSPWVLSWLQAREALGIGQVGPSGAPLFCRFGLDGEALQQEATSSEVAKVLRLALQVDDSGPQNVRSHSMKVTGLTWCGRFGLDLATRRLLGHHLDPGARSAETYNRSSMSEPVRQYHTVLAAIKTKTFNPDNTRSGEFVSSTLKSESQSPRLAKPVRSVDEISSTSESSLSESEQTSDSELDSGLPAVGDQTLLWSLVEPSVRPCFIDTGTMHEVYRNNTSGLQHLALKGAARTLCGRQVGKRYTKYSGQLIRNVPVCEPCSNHKSLTPRKVPPVESSTPAP